MFVVLQIERPNLLEAIVEITDYAKSYRPHSGEGTGITERMFCAGTPYGGNGPSSVNYYNTNQFICEITLFYSDKKKLFQ
jgi:primase-polymerase (primpol)-like protein